MDKMFGSKIPRKDNSYKWYYIIYIIVCISWIVFLFVNVNGALAFYGIISTLFCLSLACVLLSKEFK